MRHSRPAPPPSTAKHGPISRAAWTLSDLYSAGGLVYLFLKAVAGDRLWPVAMLDNLAAPLLLPALPLLALAAWRRRWRQAAPLALLAAGFAWLFGDLFLPRAARRVRSEDGVVRLRVMSFNMLSIWSDTRRVIDEIRRADAEVVGLVEYPRWKAAAIEAELGGVYPHRVQFRDGIPGIGLISKYPILDAETFVLNYPKLPHLRAVVDVDGAPLTVYVVHPPPPAFMPRYSARGSADVAELARRAASDGPALLLGDFNLADITDDYREVARAGLVDAFRAAGHGFGATWPARRRGRSLLPMVRIDYVWHTPHFTATRAWVGGRTGSDHLPVIADLEWQDGHRE